MKTISRSDYLKLLGLFTLAEHHNAQLKLLERAVLSITQEGTDIGHSYDALYGSYTVDELLRRLEITVVDDSPVGAPCIDCVTSRLCAAGCARGPR